MKLSSAVSAACLLLGTASADDHLVSRRKLSKRFIDDNGNYNISFYHVNDVHAHLDEFSSSGTDCTRPERGCFGGYARIKHTIDESRPDHPDSLFLNMGDEFQGTMFFSYYGGEKIAETLNQMGFDAMTLGNHEFDRGDEHLAEFLGNLTFPVVSANVFSTVEGLNKTIKPFHIFEEYELAVIGVTTETTPTTSSPGDGTTFTDPVKAVQDTVNWIRANTNIKRIAAMTHIGYEEDKRLAEETTGLYLIMGGHSHTLLGDMQGASGKYPTIVQNKEGEEVFIVTAYRWGEYLGYIDVTYDPEGRILEYHGAPIHLTNTTEQDAELQEQIDAWRVPFEEFSAEVIGHSNVVLDQSACQQQECLLGDFVTDAMYTYRYNASVAAGVQTPDLALTNAGGIRATIDDGPVTRGEVLTSFPFGNAIVEVQLSGQKLWDAIEGIFARVNKHNGVAVTSFLQVSHTAKIVYQPNTSPAVGTGKLVSIHINGEPLDMERVYKIVTLDFLATGGDNFFLAEDFTGELITLDTLDEVVVNYVKAETPIDIAIDGRIAVGSKCQRRKKNKKQ